MQANHYFYSYPVFDPVRSRQKVKGSRHEHFVRQKRETGFSCAHCHQWISCDFDLSGVRNRNHCPLCLWSRHMDLNKPGDRLSQCKGRMKPVGLALKKTNKKYGMDRGGELMLVHVCEACGKISINRIAADDNAFVISQVFESSLTLTSEMTSRIEHESIQILQSDDRKIVQIRLYGKSEEVSYGQSGESPIEALKTALSYC